MANKAFSCYDYDESERLSFSEAHQHCVERNGHLVHLNNPTEAYFLKAQFPGADVLWLGAETGACGKQISLWQNHCYQSHPDTVYILYLLGGFRLSNWVVKCRW